MSPLKTPNQSRLIDLIQWTGLLFVIGFTYRHFGPGATAPMSPAAIGVFGATVFLLLGPIPLKFKS
jgi:hypothetical protein